MARFRWQRGAAALLGHRHRVGLCRWAAISNARGVGVDLIDTEDGVRAAFSDLQLCGSVWVCPCCSARISEERRGELNKLLIWSRSQGLRPVMVTLTARHGADDDLAALLDRLKTAKKKLHQHRAWKSLKPVVVGSVTATEVTHGRLHGWHPHLHVLLLIDAASEADAVGLAEGLCGPWLASLRAAGLDGTGEGFRVQGAAEAGRYIGKWGAGEELALGRTKKGRRGGRTPAQLLVDAVDHGDSDAGQLWRMFAETFHGRRQLVWSRGLKALAGIGEVSDQDAAGEGEPEKRHGLCRIDHEGWSGNVLRRGARYRRGLVLDAAETGGAAAVASVVAAGGEDPLLRPGEELIEGPVHVSTGDRAPDFQPIGKSDHEAHTQCAGIFAGSRHVQHAHAHHVQAECFRSADRTEAALEDGLTAGLSGEGPWPFPAP